MKRNIIKKLIYENKPALGVMMTLTDPGCAVVLANSGFDWIFVDAEHNPFENQNIISILNSVRSRETAIIVRIRENTMENVKFMLDSGAQGIIAPQLKNADDFRKLVSFGKYPPLGERGYSPIRVTDFWSDKIDYDKYADIETMLVGQVECTQAVSQIDEIVKIEGLDGIFIGPADLSWSMGYRGDFSSREVQDTIEKIISVCNAVKMPWGTTISDAEDYKKRVDQGGTLLVYGSDSRYLRSAASSVVEACKSGNN